MFKKVSLIARIFLFALTAVWVMGLIIFGITIYQSLLDVVYYTGSVVVAYFVPAWFIITLVLVGIWAAWSGFKFIGKWEKK